MSSKDSIAILFLEEKLGQAHYIGGTVLSQLSLLCNQHSVHHFLISFLANDRPRFPSCQWKSAYTYEFLSSFWFLFDVLLFWGVVTVNVQLLSVWETRSQSMPSRALALGGTCARAIARKRASSSRSLQVPWNACMSCTKWWWQAKSIRPGMALAMRAQRFAYDGEACMDNSDSSSTRDEQCQRPSYQGSKVLCLC